MSSWSCGKIHICTGSVNAWAVVAVMHVNWAVMLQTYGANCPALFEAVRARFVSPVLPGETLQVKMWAEGARVHFIAAAKSTGKVAISQAYVDLREPARGPAPAARL